MRNSNISQKYRSQYFTTLRQGPWKLIYSYAPNSFELYHLGEDLSERNNLAQAEPERVRTLAARMLVIIEESGGQWPVLKEDGRVVAGGVQYRLCVPAVDPAIAGSLHR